MLKECCTRLLGERMKMFERIVIGLLVLVIAGLGAAFNTDWKLAVQVRSLKAFVEGYVFAEAVAACEKTQRDRKSTRLNSSHLPTSRMPSSA